jgi:hypothetical protein
MSLAVTDVQRALTTSPIRVACRPPRITLGNMILR